MAYHFMVETQDGMLIRKAVADMHENDKVVLDGPGVFAAVDAMKLSVLAEIDAAGGLEAWRQLPRPSPQR